jgi:hypothetical protein
MMDDCREVFAAFKVRGRPLPASSWPVFKWVKLRVFGSTVDAIRREIKLTVLYRLVLGYSHSQLSTTLNSV